MLGWSLVAQAAKKGKKKYGWKGFVAAGVLAMVGKRLVMKKMRNRAA